MTSRRTVVKVNVAGQELTVRSDVSPEHAHEIADYVDRSIRQVLGSGTTVDTHKAALLAALRIAGELYQARESAEAVTQSMRELSAEVRRLLPPEKREQRA